MTGQALLFATLPPAPCNPVAEVTRAAHLKGGARWDAFNAACNAVLEEIPLGPPRGAGICMICAEPVRQHDAAQIIGPFENAPAHLLKTFHTPCREAWWASVVDAAWTRLELEAADAAGGEHHG